MSDILRPYHHTAPVAGKPTTFANLEFKRSNPPELIEVDSVRWIRADMIPAEVRTDVYESLGLDR